MSEATLSASFQRFILSAVKNCEGDGTWSHTITLSWSRSQPAFTATPFVVKDEGQGRVHPLVAGLAQCSSCFFSIQSYNRFSLGLSHTILLMFLSEGFSFSSVLAILPIRG